MQGGCEPRIEVIVNVQKKSRGVRVDVNRGRGPVGRGWGQGGC